MKRTAFLDDGFDSYNFNFLRHSKRHSPRAIIVLASADGTLIIVILMPLFGFGSILSFNFITSEL